MDMAVGMIIGAAFGRSSRPRHRHPDAAHRLAMGTWISRPVHRPERRISPRSRRRRRRAPPRSLRAVHQPIISFLIVAFAVFLVVRQINRLKHEEAPAPTTKDCPQCAMPIPIAAKRCGHCTATL
jgi:large conductance mechanosensitive channel